MSFEQDCCVHVVAPRRCAAFTFLDVCSDGDVRFLEQDGFNLVEICQESLYLPVCHEEWDNFDATVVCRQSGYDECEHDSI